jgi:hypothetical protein
MSDIVHDRVKTAQAKIQELLEQYARKRDCAYYVGQFLDDEGCQNSQSGLYGMSVWLCLTSEINEGHVLELRESCKTKLKEIVNRVKRSRVVTPKADSEDYEVKNLTPKICYLFEALNQLNDAKDEAQYLLKLINESQQADSSWGFSLELGNGNPIVTSLVLRAFQNEPSFAANLKKAVVYLHSNTNQIKSFYEKLFVLNTIQIVNKSNMQVESDIKSTIKKIYGRPYYNLATSSLINVDYTDSSGKTRYFRLPTDMIFLESLALISGGNLEYLRVYEGKYIIDNLLENLNQSSKFTTDTSGHRASVGIYFFIDGVLKLISRKKASRLPSWFKDIHGWMSYSLSFGIDLAWNLILFILASSLSLIFTFFNITDLARIFLGILIKSLLDILKSISRRLQLNIR